ncbi:phosphotransferase [Streptomyces sp. NPDC046939]|uniref:phosphotransferase n=1 Tax=Streptomyces sp. NPDC046939 TaxID=3155376 RepID=UPI00340FDA28
MRPSILRRAVEAGQTVASALGLEVDQVAVVHNSDRVALRLVPCDVLVRVAPSEQRADFAFEVEVALRLTAVNAPVAVLDPRVEPRVYMRDGFAVSLWAYYAPMSVEITPAEYADALMRHHAALRQLALEAPHFTERMARALREVNDPERTPDLSDADRELLCRTLSEVSESIGADRSGGQLLHGEPHAGNLLVTARGPLFVDLATCCRGPVEFDLAHAPEGVEEYYPGADPDVLARCRAVNWALFSAWRWRREDQMPDRDRWRAEGLALVRASLDRCGPG